LSLTKASSGIPFDVDKQVAMIKATNELEKAMSEGTNYWDTFKGIDRRRTEITCMVWGMSLSLTPSSTFGTVLTEL
jgi:MFS transporter, SP family, general alpha glucoside:H+ symporter